jgi:hypothetical protein
VEGVVEEGEEEDDDDDDEVEEVVGVEVEEEVVVVVVEDEGDKDGEAPALPGVHGSTPAMASPGEVVDVSNGSEAEGNSENNSSLSSRGDSMVSSSKPSERSMHSRSRSLRSCVHTCGGESAVAPRPLPHVLLGVFWLVCMGEVEHDVYAPAAVE